jgi:hypothetical protein
MQNFTLITNHKFSLDGNKIIMEHNSNAEAKEAFDKMKAQYIKLHVLKSSEE